MKYSFIIPVFNRPDEMNELLASLTQQTDTNFEVVVIEDGSTLTCEVIVKSYEDRLDIRYFYKPNSGPGPARNYGAARATGDYLLILDSDVVVPPNYLRSIDNELQHAEADAFGGGDRAHASFTEGQKAINYAMTSFFTTGGIRGGHKKLDTFYPRSFNMGVRRTVFLALKGFSPMRFGEDIDFSLRIFAGSYRCRLFPEAWVWHKRRATLRQFFKQVHNSGIARIHLYRKHPASLKFVHLLPAIFTLGTALLLACAFFCPYCLLPLLLFALLLFVDASRKEKSLCVGAKAVRAAFTQLIGYGTGFLRAWWQCCVCGKQELEAFKQSFYQ